MNRIVNLEDLGYIVQPNESKRQIASMIQRMRKVGDCPPVYPNGWFGILESHKLNIGEARSLIALGKTLALFRDHRGQAHILDAYCPHMGANIGVGGRVHGDCIECPFHGWRFRGEDGKCVKIPYAEGENYPESANIKSYIVCEINNWIHLWFDAEGRQPYWHIPEIPEISSNEWTYRGRTQHHVNAHIEEVPENGADVVHLNVVHGPAIFLGVDLRYIFNKWFSFSGHRWSADWQALEGDESHIGLLKLTHDFTVWGIPLPLMSLKVTAKQIGPGLVYLFIDSIFGRGMFLQTLLPEEPLMLKLVHNMYGGFWMPNIVAKSYMLGEARQVERDLMIWNNKRYSNRPCFVKSKEDALVARHRKWYKQFYSEHSPRLTMRESDKDCTDW